MLATTATTARLLASRGGPRLAHRAAWGLRGAELHTSAHMAAKTYRLRYAYGEPPLHNMDKLAEVEASGQMEDYEYKKIRFARLWESDSLFQDELIERFARRMMRDGRKGLMYQLLDDTCYAIKSRQFLRRRKQQERLEEAKREGAKAGSKTARSEEEEQIELDPVVIFNKAVANCRPQVTTRKVQRGGSTYNVPYPVTDFESDVIAMSWIHLAAKDRPKPRRRHYPEALADELLDASKGQGKIVKTRDDVHRLAQANKAYAHYRWG